MVTPLIFLINNKSNVYEWFERQIWESSYL